MRKRIVILDGGLDFSGFRHDDGGYWNPENVGRPVVIGGNRITMKGVDRNLVGVSNTGDAKLMRPGREYVFEGDEVLELPADGGLIDFDTLNRRRQYGKDLAVIENYFRRNGIDDGLKKFQWAGPVSDQQPQDNTRVNMPDYRLRHFTTDFDEDYSWRWAKLHNGTPYNIDDKYITLRDIFVKDPELGGYYDYADNNIYLNEYNKKKILDNSVTEHEKSHFYRANQDGILDPQKRNERLDKGTEEEYSILQNAYNMIENTPKKEFFSTNSQVRAAIMKKTGLKGEELDKYIDNLSDFELELYYYNANGYIDQNKPVNTENLRKALKEVALIQNLRNGKPLFGQGLQGYQSRV